MVKWPKEGHRTAVEIKPLQRQPNLNMINMDSKAIWGMADYTKAPFPDLSPALAAALIKLHKTTNR